MKTYIVKLTETEGFFIDLTIKAVSPTVAIAEAIALVNDASTAPWDIVEISCRVA